MLADVEFTLRPGCVVAAMRGEIDLSNAAALRDAVRQQVTADVDAVVLDMSGVDYLDSAGIQLIYRLRDELSARGKLLHVVIPPDSPVNDALELAGVASEVRARASLESALGS